MTEIRTAKARFGYAGRIIVDDCPYCHKQHTHSAPIGEGQRMANCFQGEYILDFTQDVITQRIDTAGYTACGVRPRNVRAVGGCPTEKENYG